MVLKYDGEQEQTRKERNKEMCMNSQLVLPESILSSWEKQPDFSQSSMWKTSEKKKITFQVTPQHSSVYDMMSQTCRAHTVRKILCNENA